MRVSRLTARSAAFHPLGLTLLGCSAVLAVLMMAVPQLSPWSGRAALLVAAGVIAYVATVAVVSRQLSPGQKPVDRQQGSGDEEDRASLPPQPSDFADHTRRALRALSQPGTLAKSPLIHLLPVSLLSVWQSAQPKLCEPSPLEQSQALHTLLMDAIERLNVSDVGSTRANQYQVLHMQYVLGLTVTQVGVRLGVAEQTVFRRSAEGVQAVATDLWRREQLAYQSASM